MAALRIRVKRCVVCKHTKFAHGIPSNRGKCAVTQCKCKKFVGSWMEFLLPETAYKRIFSWIERSR